MNADGRVRLLLIMRQGVSVRAWMAEGKGTVRNVLSLCCGNHVCSVHGQ